MFRVLLEQFCQEFQLDSPDWKKPHLCVLSLNDTIEVTLSDLNPGVSLQATIGSCPEDHQEELFSYMMRANLLGQGTGTSRIGLDAQEKFLTLSRGLPYELNYPLFRDAFEDFVNHLLFWRQEIEKFEDV